MLSSLNAKAAILSVVMLAVFLLVWEFGNQPPEAKENLSEYEMLMGDPSHRPGSPIPPRSGRLRWMS